FIVRAALPGRRSPILYKVATFTRHAYNLAGASGRDGGSSLYQHPVYLGPGAPGKPRGHKVSMRRPAGDSHYSLWDLPFVAWLERNGYPVEFCSDLDLHEDPALPGAYRLLLSAGHDEYWSEPMRSGVERFVAAGGNAAFFSGNVCWWRVHPVDANTALACDTDHAASADAHHFPATDQWWVPEPEGAGQPENTLTGVSFRNAGEWAGWFEPGERPHLGFRLQHTDHWVFAGTGLRGAEGGRPDVLGAGTDLVGYECDGATYQAAANGVAIADGRGGTPPPFVILGVAVLAPRREDYYDESPGAWRCPPREPGAASPPAATMGVHTMPGGGTVFTAATTNWPVVVGTGADPAVERITRNVLDTLTRR
ncbi:MAG TPA: N,N-dimethylformamidase beta subunit family domain-containing protein, partial [Actinomycetota bacterium]|nr:N,N-dimethylformamidase beta subunit family domain-containing protein [Actinomycetota bacterium]